MALEKHEIEARDLDGGVVGMTCVSDEDGAEGTSPESASPAHEQTSRDLFEGAKEAVGGRDGENDGESEDESDDQSDDENEETGSNDDTWEHAKSDASSEDSWSDETPPLNLNYEALKHIVEHFLPGSHGACVKITTMRRGSFHEIRVLHFADGWSCIARFTRDYEMLQKTESELATMTYVRNNTTIPVPEVYLINHNENHAVGAAFVIMERLNGKTLCNIWRDIPLEHKLAVIEQLADVVWRLSEQKFDRIGSLTANGTIGPLLHLTEDTQPVADHAFSSTIEYLFSFLKDDNVARKKTAREQYPAIREELRSFMERNATNALIHAPYRLMHIDPDMQNIIVVPSDGPYPLKISGILDWDWAHTAPVYYLWEYPTFICDSHFFKIDYDDNKALRKHFVASLIQHFPEDSPERKLVKQCFREKSFILNRFYSVFMTQEYEDEVSLVNSYLAGLRGETDEWWRQPYGGRLDWKMDSDLEDSDAETESDDDTSGDSYTGSEDDSEDPSENCLDNGFEGGSQGEDEAGSHTP